MSKLWECWIFKIWRVRIYNRNPARVLNSGRVFTSMNVQKIFTSFGGTFHVPVSTLKKKLHSVEAYFFDWDGVFNDGRKDSSSDGSNFSEVDSMGINLLRFGHWLQFGKLPFTAIITGEQNPPAIHFAEREHFDCVYYKVKHKIEAAKEMEKKYSISLEKSVFIFDDVLDVSLAEHCGVRFFVQRKSAPLFSSFLKEKNLVEYSTGNTSSQFGVREVCELILGIQQYYNIVLEKRIAFDDDYQNYLQAKEKIVTEIQQYGKTGKI